MSTELPNQPSASTRARNRDLWPASADQHALTVGSVVLGPVTGKRIRQDPKPLLSKIEGEYMAYLKAGHPFITIHAQAIKLRLANGAFYKADLAAVIAGKLTLFDTKGGKKMKGVAKGTLAIKVAASTYPEFDFWLVWRQDGMWITQRVLS